MSGSSATQAWPYGGAYMARRSFFLGLYADISRCLQDCQPDLMMTIASYVAHRYVQIFRGDVAAASLIPEYVAIAEQTNWCSFHPGMEPVAAGGHVP